VLQVLVDLTPRDVGLAREQRGLAEIARHVDAIQRRVLREGPGPRRTAAVGRVGVRAARALLRRTGDLTAEELERLFGRDLLRVEGGEHLVPSLVDRELGDAGEVELGLHVCGPPSPT
jgi:hypothetical protein